MRKVFVGLILALVLVPTCLAQGDWDLSWSQDSQEELINGTTSNTSVLNGEVKLMDEEIRGEENREINCNLNTVCQGEVTFEDFSRISPVSAHLTVGVMSTTYGREGEFPGSVDQVEYIEVDGDDKGQCNPTTSYCSGYHPCFDEDVTQEAEDNNVTVEVKNTNNVFWQCFRKPWVKVNLTWREVGFREKGSYVSQVKDFGEYLYLTQLRVDSEVNGQELRGEIQTSKDGFQSFDRKEFSLGGGTESVDLLSENLSGGQVRVIFNFSSNFSHSPRLNNFSVEARRMGSWLEKIEPSTDIGGERFVNGSFRVYWNSSLPEKVKEYQVEYREDGEWKEWKNTSNSSGDWEQVEDGRSYNFRVREVDINGRVGNWSQVKGVRVDSGAPQCEIGLGKKMGRTITLGWNCSDEGSGMKDTRFQVNRTGWKNVSQVCQTVRECTGFNCTGSANCSFPSSPYSFRLRGEDNIGNQGEWEKANFSVCRDLDGDGFCWEGEDCNDTDPEVNPNESEICDGIDNDCDRRVDEDFVVNNVPLGSECWTGVCRGVWVCNQNGTARVCSGNYTPGELPEYCGDGKDNDCDGQIDEEDCVCKEGEKRDCGIGTGRCEQGFQVCRNGTWSECREDVEPEEEICEDGVDNDCDGEVDEAVEVRGGRKVSACRCKEGSSKVCGSNIGHCETGSMVCINGQWGECRGSVGPEEEVCNGKDEDCDGIVDNIGGRESIEGTRCGCYGGKRPKKEVCNDVDDDCDGQKDEGLNCCELGEVRECEESGICAQGVQECVDGEWGQCSIQPGEEVCGNDMDDDCDGETDEDCGRVDVTLYIVFIIIGAALLVATLTLETAV